MKRKVVKINEHDRAVMLSALDDSDAYIETVDGATFDALNPDGERERILAANASLRRKLLLNGKEAG